MTDGVDASVVAVQPALLDALEHRRVVEPGRGELRAGDQTVLAPGEPGENGVRRGGWLAFLASWDRFAGHPPMMARRDAPITPLTRRFCNAGAPTHSQPLATPEYGLKCRRTGAACARRV